MEETRKSKMKDDWIVALSLAECLMFLILVVFVVGGLALGAGFYLGTHHKNNQLNAVIGLAQDLSEAHGNERAAVQANYQTLVNQVERYETFLVGVEGSRKGAVGSAQGGQ